MSKENLPSLGDHHTHAQDVVFHNPESAKAFKINVGDHLYPSVPTKKYVEHVTRSNLDTLWLIFEDEKLFNSIREALKTASPETKVNGFYWIRNPKEIDLETINKLYKKGSLHGIKVHPVIDNYPLSPESLSQVVEIAEKLDIPIIFHSDDRKESMHLTSPDKQLSLVEEYPHVRFVIGHGGSYANPRIVGEKNTGAIAYWAGNQRTTSRKVLINKALTLTLTKENAFYDLSVTTNKIKAKLVADFVRDNPKVAGKILAGSDFPVLGARLDSQLLALSKAGLPRNLLIQIAKNRL